VDSDAARDVIEEPIEDDLDISGWDLKKTLRLLRKIKPGPHGMDVITHHLQGGTGFYKSDDRINGAVLFQYHLLPPLFSHGLGQLP
jgi:hypothetical protein